MRRQRIAVVAVMPVAAVVDMKAAADTGKLIAAASSSGWTKKRRSLTAPPLCFYGDSSRNYYLGWSSCNRDTV
jgi:hypothetical protein